YQHRDIAVMFRVLSELSDGEPSRVPPWYA
ncbi:MAG: hypothetical protein JWR83_3243, partial [Aeromicrobium sp.]|nr:hypothetical protein [Aeromicrobium sp.]